MASSLAPLVSYTVNVTNLGSRDADEVVLGFLRPPNAGVDGTPLQVLFDFQRVHVRAGQTVAVTLQSFLVDIWQVSESGRWKAVAGSYRFEFGVDGSRVLSSGPRHDRPSPAFASHM